MATRTEVIRALRQRYGQAARSEKGRILDEFVKLTKYHRKHAVRVLSRDGTKSAAREEDWPSNLRRSGAASAYRDLGGR